MFERAREREVVVRADRNVHGHAFFDLSNFSLIDEAHKDQVGHVCDAGDGCPLVEGVGFDDGGPFFDVYGEHHPRHRGSDLGVDDACTTSRALADDLEGGARGGILLLRELVRRGGRIDLGLADGLRAEQALRALELGESVCALNGGLFERGFGVVQGGVVGMTRIVAINEPASTTSPGSTRTVSTRPETRLLIATSLRGRMEPVATVFCSMSARKAFVVRISSSSVSLLDHRKRPLPTMRSPASRVPATARLLNMVTPSLER